MNMAEPTAEAAAVAELTLNYSGYDSPDSETHSQNKASCIIADQLLEIQALKAKLLSNTGLEKQLLASQSKVMN